MINLGHNGGYILSSYAVSVVLMGTFALLAARRYAAAKRKLAQLTGSADGSVHSGASNSADG